MTILCYHSIDPDWEDPLAVAPAAFARQMEVVAHRRHLALSDYVAALRARALPRGAVAVTFDDGYRDNLEAAAPVCRGLGIRPTIFLAVGHIESGEPLGWRDDVRRANEPLGWDGVRELVESGWEVGLHTWAHRDLVAAADPDVAEELAHSRTRIAQELGRACDTISYPYGRHDQRVRQAARRAGYDAAFTLPTGREYHDTALAIPRIGVFRGDGSAAFRLKLSRPVVAAKLLFVKPHAVAGSDESAAAGSPEGSR